MSLRNRASTSLHHGCGCRAHQHSLASSTVAVEFHGRRGDRNRRMARSLRWRSGGRNSSATMGSALEADLLCLLSCSNSPGHSALVGSSGCGSGVVPSVFGAALWHAGRAVSAARQAFDGGWPQVSFPLLERAAGGRFRLPQSLGRCCEATKITPRRWRR